jgi:hypothetical protein
METWKTLWPSKKYTVFSGWAGDFEQFEFVPGTHIETMETAVAYAIPGADVQATTIQLGQLLGMNAISLHTLRARHPHIADPDAEARRVEEEVLEQAALQSLQQQAMAGAIPPVYLAKVERFRKRSADIFEAIEKAEVEVVSYRQQTPELPDSVFPNNWFSTHRNADIPDGLFVLYPMRVPSREKEKNPLIIAE